MHNCAYHLLNMHGAKFCTKIYANGMNTQVDTSCHPDQQRPLSTLIVFTTHSHISYQVIFGCALTAPARALATHCPCFSSSLPVVSSSLLARSTRESRTPTCTRITVNGLYCTPTENLSRFCKIFAIFRINCFLVWNN